MNRELLQQYVKNQLTDVDIRTDQCDVVRVYWRGRASFVKDSDDGIKISIVLRPAPNTPDFLSSPSISETAYDEMEAAKKLTHWLNRVVATDVDSPDAWET